MSERPGDSSGLTNDDPRAPASLDQRPERPHGGVPERATAPPPFAEPESPGAEYAGGYTSAPPPGVFGGFARSIGADEPGPGTYRLAGWWSRAGAALLDLVVIGVGGLLLLALVGAVFSVGFFASDTAGIISVMVGLMLAFAAFAVIALLYSPLMMARTDGQTLGRKAMGIRVIRVSGEPMTFGWAMLREVAVKWLLFGVVGGSTTFGLAGLLDVLWPLWDEENRALHDFIAGTRVVEA